ncbi:MAG: hypothetical protein ABMB14_28405 [Myxococcota bacterium]
MFVLPLVQGWSSGVAVAADSACEPHAIEEARAAWSGAAAVVVRGLEAEVEVVAGAGDAVVVSGSACGDPAVSAVRRGDVITVSAKRSRGAALTLTVAVPSSTPVLSVQELTGDLVIHGVEARVAVVSSVGTIDVTDAASLRIAYGAGDVSVDGLGGDLVVDRLAGVVTARRVGGDVVADGVTGDVTVDDVAGDLAVRGSGGRVLPTNVRGTVDLP